MPLDIRGKKLVPQVPLDILGVTLSLGSELKHALGDLYCSPLTLKGKRRARENFVENITKHLHRGCVVSHELSPDPLSPEKSGAELEIRVSAPPIFKLSTEIPVGV
ncbi:hypothetical protein [Bradyrhizobium sp. DASA03120]|uniref:hypothetical protein n=1 Tax=Bradyrhizobium sp. SMVTL-02 TaxID=3395917 RepID=UPI003F6FE6A7